MSVILSVAQLEALYRAVRIGAAAYGCERPGRAAKRMW
jgi:hypothetical protein